MSFKMSNGLKTSDHCMVSVNIDFDLSSPVCPSSLRPFNVQDEDSGLGMDLTEEENFDEGEESISLNTTPGFDDKKLNNIPKFSARKSLFGQKRTRIDSDAIMQPEKKRRWSEGDDISASMGSLSFEDVKTTPKCDADYVTDAVNRFLEHDDVTGNGSQTYCLPTIPGNHPDLKSITCQTLSDVLNGHYSDVIHSYRIIDCRYPYEYKSGHIKGAENLYTKDMIQTLINKNATPTAQSSKRDILIFHCEFSSARGPKMYRLLRQLDREINSERYPLLHYPELYLLHDGYKMFYHTCQELCDPIGYMPMHHDSHASDLRHFRSKSKSWCVGDRRRRMQSRLIFSDS